MSRVKNRELLEGTELTLRMKNHHYVNRKVWCYQPWEGLSWPSQLIPEKRPNEREKHHATQVNISSVTKLT